MRQLYTVVCLLLFAGIVTFILTLLAELLF